MAKLDACQGESSFSASSRAAGYTHVSSSTFNNHSTGEGSHRTISPAAVALPSRRSRVCNRCCLVGLVVDRQKVLTTTGFGLVRSASHRAGRLWFQDSMCIDLAPTETLFRTRSAHSPEFRLHCRHTLSILRPCESVTLVCAVSDATRGIHGRVVWEVRTDERLHGVVVTESYQSSLFLGLDSGVPVASCVGPVARQCGI